MLTAPSAVFLVNLVQDVNILRPLIYMAARDFGLDSLLLVSAKFSGRDLFGIWRSELDQICRETGARVEVFADDWEAHQHLTSHGVIFAASESHLNNHATTHSIFLHAPHGYLRVTLQHGFECVGFHHSEDHVRAHGATASFGSDLVCSWLEEDELFSMSESQKCKVHVAGPTSVLQRPVGQFERSGTEPGLVCENLHSVRLSGAGDFKSEFVAAFDEFCRAAAANDMTVVLRPHPGGQYAVKNKLPLPPNASINNAPIYRLDLRRFAYGISAPSSVLVDMLFAGIPTAVWRDHAGDMDANNYAGLTTVSTAAEWADFARAATADPAPFIQIQQQFLTRQRLIFDRETVYARYAEIFRAALRREVRPVGAAAERQRLLFVANARVPTLQLSFEKPLAPLVNRGEIRTELLTEQFLRQQPGLDGDPQREAEWIDALLDRYGPSTIIFCRYSGPAYRPIVDWARRNKVPTIYQIDDDLLAIPAEVGERKHALHNSQERLDAVRDLLTSVNLVYASTDKLRERLLHYFPGMRLRVGEIYCSSTVLRRPRNGPARYVGYMASADHAHNLEMVLPAIEQLLERNPDVQLELFGSVPIPSSLDRFRDRIATVPPVDSYEQFLETFVARGWNVGICPLNPIEFNLMKANTKWVEYTAVGAAVVASKGTVYDQCCADGCGILANTIDEWLESLELLVRNDRERLSIVDRAQRKLESEYSTSRLRQQVLDLIAEAHDIVHQSDPFKKRERVCVG
jgi:glycosyltransferase involved in cell wall biosynthesis